MSAFTFEEPGLDPAGGFAFHPVADDRPRRARPLALIALTVVLVAALGAGLAWGIGYLVNEQLARMLTR